MQYRCANLPWLGKDCAWAVFSEHATFATGAARRANLLDSLSVERLHLSEGLNQAVSLFRAANRDADAVAQPDLVVVAYQDPLAFKCQLEFFGLTPGDVTEDKVGMRRVWMQIRNCLQAAQQPLSFVL
jgi:hypothetical protein